MKRKKISTKASKKIFKNTASTMNSYNIPKIQRGGIRF